MTGLYLTNNQPSAPLPKYCPPHMSPCVCHPVSCTQPPSPGFSQVYSDTPVVLSPACHLVLSPCLLYPTTLTMLLSGVLRHSTLYCPPRVTLSLVPNYTQTLLFFVMQSWAHVNIITTRHRVFISACVNASICRPFNCVLVNEPQSTTRQKIPHIPSTYLRVSHVSCRCTLYIQCTVPSPIVLSTPVCHF